mmetsp:Transcript_177416/g.568930  ORF Transcript_177416/g.568930 Transcript_177416/m.568930 type:complete len:239 (-) Transcript_177416:12-728(-)
MKGWYTCNIEGVAAMRTATWSAILAPPWPPSKRNGPDQAGRTTCSNSRRLSAAHSALRISTKSPNLSREPSSQCSSNLSRELKALMSSSNVWEQLAVSPNSKASPCNAKISAHASGQTAQASPSLKATQTRGSESKAHLTNSGCTLKLAAEDPSQASPKDFSTIGAQESSKCPVVVSVSSPSKLLHAGAALQKQHGLESSPSGQFDGTNKSNTPKVAVRMHRMVTHAHAQRHWPPTGT